MCRLHATCLLHQHMHIVCLILRSKHSTYKLSLHVLKFIQTTNYGYKVALETELNFDVLLHLFKTEFHSFIIQAYLDNFSEA